MLFQEEVLLVGGLGTYKVLPPIALHSLEIVTSILTNIYLFTDWNGFYENSKKKKSHNRKGKKSQKSANPKHHWSKIVLDRTALNSKGQTSNPLIPLQTGRSS